MVWKIIICLFISFASLATLEARSQQEQARIEQLIQRVSRMPDAKFIRNGSAHAAHDAAKHLKMKLKRAGARVQTAEDFIDGVASKSSLSGRAYKIRLRDGREMEMDDFLRSQLEEIESRGG